METNQNLPVFDLVIDFARMNGPAKIEVHLTFEEFNALDVLAASELASIARADRSTFGDRVRAAAAKLAAVRPAEYARMIRAANDNSVCD
jgi:hypothetical protein